MRFKIDSASLIGTYISRGDLTEGFCVSGLEGLCLEGLIHGRAYFRNFTVSGLRIEDIEEIKNRKENILKNFFCSILVH